MAGRLPNFLIVGSPKCGTTSLADWLRAHPQVYVPPLKEQQFFNIEERWSRGVDWYADQFAAAGDATAVGEGTPLYMLWEPTLERIARVLPDARLIACLREPASRAYSQWHDWRYRQAREGRSFARAMADELAAYDPAGEDAEHFDFDRPGAHYLRHGHYLPQLEQVCRHFPRERLHVVLLEDLHREPHETFAQVCRFLGVDDGVLPEDVGRRVNRAIQFRPHLPWRLLVHHKDKLPPALAKWMALNLFWRRRVTPRPMAPAVRARLREHFDEDNRRLAEWLGRDLSAWGPAAPVPAAAAK